MDLKLSDYHVATPSFFDEARGQALRILFATRTAQLRIVDEGTYQKISTGQYSLLPAELIADLADAELLVPAGEDELATVLGRNQSAITAESVLRLVLHPSAYCQLGCGYCGQEHRLKWLSEEHAGKLMRRVSDRLSAKAFQAVAVCWFGAEPLTGMNVIRLLTPRLQDLAEKSGCRYTASVVTNGLALSERVLTELVAKHAVTQLHLTLDGPREHHDIRRHRKNGDPTFDRIFRNITAAAHRTDLDVSISIRTNVDRRNQDGVIPLLRLLADAGLQQKVGYYVAPIHSWGNDAHRLALSPEEFARLEIDWLCEMMQLGFMPGLLPGRNPVTCVAVEPHSMVVDAAGDMFNCTEASYVPTYGKPNLLATGHVSTGEDPARRRLLGDFNVHVANGDYPCTSCRMLPVCGGACPKAWLEGNEPCPSARRNIEARLLLWFAGERIRADAETASTASQVN
jgi:uncharacterized protein